MQRIELSGAKHDIGGIMGSAYKDEKGRRIVAVYVNMAAEPQTIEVGFDLGSKAWRLGSLTPYVTSDRDGDELKAYPDVPASEAIRIPARSVVTLVGQFS
jgi:hypothetical protein